MVSLIHFVFVTILCNTSLAQVDDIGREAHGGGDVVQKKKHSKTKAGMGVLGVVSMIPMMLGGGMGGGGGPDYAGDMAMEIGTMQDAIRAGDTATMNAISDDWNQKLSLVSTSLQLSQQYLADELAEYDNMNKAAVDAAVAEEVAKNKEKLNAVMLEKANAQAKLELSKQVGELNQSLAESMTALKKETAQMTADERAAAYQQALATSKMNFEQVRSTQKEYNAKILKNREDQFNQLMSTYFNLSNKNEEERQETLKRIEHEKDRYMSEVKMSMEKSAENDELFMNLMKAKNSNAQNMMDRADSLYLNDTDQEQEEEDFQQLIDTMNESSAAKMQIEREKQAEMTDMQMQMLTDQMRLDQETKLAEAQAKTDSEVLAVQSEYATSLYDLQSQSNDQQESIEKRYDEKNTSENEKMVRSMMQYNTSSSIGSGPLAQEVPEGIQTRYTSCLIPVMTILFLSL
eukprot:GHVH01006538.1.p1 GENE.GHVH01006538.1~~GHVH01006538.1.p1  ORF type:complete len:460 (+),score=98.68 GHVH01006538.1:141-1520(+)